MRRSSIPYACLTLIALHAGCLPDADFADGLADPAPAGAPAPVLPPEAGALRLLTWNIEWLGATDEGPSDEAGQLAAAERSLSALSPGIAGLQELASTASAEALRAALPDAALVSSRYAQRQNVALLYDARRFTQVATRAIEGLDDAGRPPLEVELQAVSDPARRLIAIVLHAKAGDDVSARAQRQRLAEGLRAHLDREHAGRDVIVLGDFNDGFTRSTVEGYATPWAVLIEGDKYVAPTSALEAGREQSARWGATVDHIVLSAPLRGAVIAGSPNVQRDELLASEPDFFEAVSDHTPVTLELSWP